ncbi:type I-C CRISPR-associated protein Cas7/Csd2 [Schleiferilactobacillus perolens]|uniref:CRISPR-associated Csd2 family protein n=1 Tax=Schleiferilactobacillus perolens DSM 12744 TaxID=1423792 RepID=A0A0R1MIC5_9LACO|nr:type I-C CRISPR-associated protein Cas7/Csd2 [Schleiferilactobacillus perolens]KRL07751.1 CRISPR-associated Csd2 family protein [Schleiferilactobacillus perolens DSM 12744]
MTKVLDHKIDFSVVVGVKNANPNGDPLDANRPRVNADGLGEISDVALKRKIRNRWQDMGLNVLILQRDRITDGATNIRDRVKMSDAVNEVLAEKADKKAKLDNWRERFIDAATASWIDVRSFGQVMPFKAGPKDGLDGVSIPVRGPVTVQAAYSIKPVTVKEEQITKSINLEPGESKGSDTMGTKSMVPFAVYKFNGSINVQQAERTGFSDEDAVALKEALRTLFINDASAARPEGSMAVLRLVWWEHDNKLGKLAPYLVHAATHVDYPDNAEDFSQVQISVEDPAVEGLTPEIIKGY